MKLINKAELRKAIGQRIRFLRGNLTQAEFGKMLGKSQDSICAYEKGIVFPPLDVIIMLADQTKAPMEWIIRGDVTDKGRPSEEVGIVFKGKLIRKGDIEWEVLEKITDLPQEIKEKIKLLVEAAVKVETEKTKAETEQTKE